MLLSENDIKRINEFGAGQKPFVFIIDYAGKKVHLVPAEKAADEDIYYFLPGYNNISLAYTNGMDFDFRSTPPAFEEYLSTYNKVHKELAYGNSFLLNLTFKIPVQTSLSLEDIFLRSLSPYKLFFKNQFVVFSPESFIKINENKIFSYPMKGTIDASIENAREVILNDKKEFSEHATIVDLIRNDLSRVAENVKVSRFRFITEVQTHHKKLIQVSSEISGDLMYDFPGELGNILNELLPAGSITGAPKKKTCEIISHAETSPRGYYTGVFGFFDGQSLDSAVMIRFIETDNGNTYYHTGGGITVYSNPESEYREIIDKVYVPII